MIESSRYEIIDSIGRNCIAVPIYADEGRLEDRTLHEKDFDECMKTSIITAIRYDLELVGVQIIASENGRKRTTDYYIGDVAAVDAEGRPSRVRVGQFSYGAGDFRSYADVGSRKHSIEICPGRVSLAKKCAQILELPYIFPLEEVTKREVPKEKVLKR